MSGSLNIAPQPQAHTVPLGKGIINYSTPSTASIETNAQTVSQAANPHDVAVAQHKYQVLLDAHAKAQPGAQAKQRVQTTGAQHQGKKSYDILRQLSAGPVNRVIRPAISNTANFSAGFNRTPRNINALKMTPAVQKAPPAPSINAAPTITTGIPAEQQQKLQRQQAWQNSPQGARNRSTLATAIKLAIDPVGTVAVAAMRPKAAPRRRMDMAYTA